MNAEQNRNERRDKKRKTRMVMDNAGVRRIIQHVAKDKKPALRRP